MNILNVKRKCTCSKSRLELTKGFSHFFQMYKHERPDILETHLKGALEEGLFSNLENS